LNKTIYILLTSIILVLPILALASEVNNDYNKKSAQEGNVKIAPSTINSVDPLEESKIEVVIPEITIETNQNRLIQIDSSNNSISKYNYIFYFIYKYKYENKMDIEGLDQISLEE
jgi:hypothetical protein